MRLLRVKNPSGQQQIARLLFSNLAQQKSRDDCRNETNAHLGVSKFGFWSRKREIAKQSESGAAGDGGTIHGRNRHFGKLVKRAKQAHHSLGVFEILFRRAAEQRLQVLKVQAGTERFTRPRENEDDGG